MKIFKLPDLGEGLTEAEVHEWHVKEGDTVTADQPMVSMETAKAVVDVPAPRTGTIAKLYGQVGDIIDTGAPLVEFTDDDEKRTHSATADQGSVVGNLSHQSTIVLDNLPFASGVSKAISSAKALPAVRALAKQLNVDLDKVTGTGVNGQITKTDIETAASASRAHLEDFHTLKGVRRSMAKSMSLSHAEVVPVSVYDDADIHAWAEGTDITLRVIRAVIYACQQEPALNALYDGKSISRKIVDTVHLGLAMDSADGLFVPVIKHAEQQGAATLRSAIERFKQQVSDRSIPQDELQGWTIMLSNFGTFAGRYASPIVVPPSVAIIGTGRIRQQATVVGNTVEAHRVIPLSLTFDHRAVTGGEATRFLACLLEDLAKSN